MTFEICFHCCVKWKPQSGREWLSALLPKILVRGIRPDGDDLDLRILIGIEAAKPFDGDNVIFILGRGMLSVEDAARDAAALNEISTHIVLILSYTLYKAITCRIIKKNNVKPSLPKNAKI